MGNMSKNKGFLGLSVSLILLLFIKAEGQKLPEVVIMTSVGNIRVQVDTIKAPVTARNFLFLSGQGVFRNSSFYRVVRSDNQPDNHIKIEVVQGGLFHEEKITGFQQVTHETTIKTGIKHTDGTISMARMEPGTASTEFFICIGDQPDLDFGGRRNPDGQGFAAFGKVLEGMETVKLIQHQDDENQYLRVPVIIKDIVRVN